MALSSHLSLIEEINEQIYRIKYCFDKFNERYTTSDFRALRNKLQDIVSFLSSLSFFLLLLLISSLSSFLFFSFSINFWYSRLAHYRMTILRTSMVTVRYLVWRKERKEDRERRKERGGNGISPREPDAAAAAAVPGYKGGRRPLPTSGGVSSLLYIAKPQQQQQQ